MRVALHPCYFIHLRPYRETSMLVDVLSRERGRVTLVAKGARKSRQRSLYQPLRKVNIAWVMRSELGTLTQIEAASPGAPVEGQAALAALYVNELMMRLLHAHEAHPELFDDYDQTLDRLARSGGSESVLRIFEKRLVNSLGYGVILDHDVRGNTIEPGRTYHYLAQQGPSLEEAREAASVPVSGATLAALHGETLSAPAQLAEAKKLMRFLLSDLLGARPLASREIYRRYLSIQRGQ